MKAADPQYAVVEQPFGIKPPIVHCPICGSSQIDDDDVSPCEHLSFLFVGAIGEFIFQKKNFEDRFVSFVEDLELSNFKDLLSRAGYDNKLLALEITYGGMACGPVWYTDVYGFDYSTIEA